MFHFLCLGVFLFLLELVFLISDLFKVVEVALIVCELHVEEMYDLVDGVVEEVSSVTNNEYSDVKSLDVVFKPDECVKIQVIGRLIQ